MQRRFECKNCQALFEADNTKNVQCPKCGSDNVEYVQFHIPVKFWKLGGILLVILAVGLLIVNIDRFQPSTQYSVGGEVKDTAQIERDTTYINETGLQLPAEINVGELVFEADGYKFDITVKNPPLQNFYFAVVEYHGEKIVAKSNDGRFAGVPYSPDDGGTYTLSLFDASTDTIICSIEKPGFIRQIAVAQKMTLAVLQSKIDNRDISLEGAGENEYLSPDYKLEFVGLSSDAVNIPSTLGEIFDKLDNEIWKSVKVNSLEYDDMNRISKIVLIIKEF